MTLADGQTVPVNTTFNRILFATDFSQTSSSALAYAMAMAHKYHSRIYAAHVKPEPPGLPASSRAGLHALSGAATTPCGNPVPALERRLGSIPHEIILATGRVWPELSKIPRTNRVDLIVVGTHGHTGFAKLRMGSVAEEIFRRAGCPVLAVSPAVTLDPENATDLHSVLFTTDFSIESLAALPVAISLTQQNDARLYILHVVEAPPTQIDDVDLKDRLLDLLPKTMEFKSRPKVMLEFGLPAERILHVAKELAIDLIVLGVKRASGSGEGSTHVPLASTAYDVARQASCPVLTLRS